MSVIAGSESPTGYRRLAGKPESHQSIDRTRALQSVDDILSIKNWRFLVAEDQQVQRAVLVQALRSLGATNIAEAADGQMAANIFWNTDPGFDVVIIDLKMPGMDGLEFIRHLAKEHVSVSIILASALDRPLVAAVETMTKAYGLNLLGSLEKPVTTKSLQALFERHKALQRTLHAPATPRSSAPAFTREELAEGLNDERFEPFFQPKVNMATGRVDGLEALARWCHPLHGVVGPAAFIKPMETHGLIDRLTWAILKQAAEFCCACRKSGVEITVSVNLSHKSLNEPGLAEFVTELVRNENVEPRHIVLEVTETSVMTNLAIGLENLARLRMNGFGLSIDDYGTGYSSMQRLAHIAFTELKIDRSFVINALKHDSSRIILGSSIDMAKKLKISAVAEGIETEEQWNLIAGLQCDLAQGHFIAKPMEAERCLGWIRERR